MFNFAVRRVPNAHPYALLTLAALFWAGNVVLGRAIVGHVPPFTLNSLRWALALAILAPIAWPQLRGNARIVQLRISALVLLSLPSVAFYNALLYLGARLTTATNASLIVATMPMAILLLARLAGQEHLRPLRAAGVAVAFAGVACAVLKGDLATLRTLSFSSGDILIIGCVFCWASYSVLFRHFAIPLDGFSLLTVLSAIGLPASLPLCAWEMARGERVVWDGTTIVAIAYVGTLPSIVATIFWNHSVSRVGAATAGLFWNFIPVFSIVLAMAFLGESLATFHLVGMALILGGVCLATGQAAFRDTAVNPARPADDVGQPPSPAAKVPAAAAPPLASPLTTARLR